MKPKIAFFDFASCEGCQLALLDCEDILLEILELVDLVEFREAISESLSKTSEHYDIAFIEGSIHREIDSKRLLDIRSRSNYLVALGACACHGNVQARANFISPTENYQRVYGTEVQKRVQSDKKYADLWAHNKVRAIDEIVKVDYYLRGCPMSSDEFLNLLKALLSQQIPAVPANAVCMECKRNANECVFDKSETCLGPITYGGCNAICINHGHVCDGCRGLLPDANVKAHNELMLSRGLSKKAIENRYRLFCSAEKSL